jgi:excisionase family DNA binding protein
MNTDIPMTADQVAEYLQIHRETVMRMVRARQIPFGRIGKQYRFFRTEIDEFVRRMKRT